MRTRGEGMEEPYGAWLVTDLRHEGITESMSSPVSGAWSPVATSF